MSKKVIKKESVKDTGKVKKIKTTLKPEEERIVDGPNLNEFIEDSNSREAVIINSEDNSKEDMLKECILDPKENKLILSSIYGKFGKTEEYDEAMRILEVVYNNISKRKVILRVAHVKRVYDIAWALYSKISLAPGNTLFILQADLTAASLLHDIAKFVDDRRHPEIGAELIKFYLDKNKYNLDFIGDAILYHNKKGDKFKSENMLSKILHDADILDKLSIERIYEKTLYNMKLVDEYLDKVALLEQYLLLDVSKENFKLTMNHVRIFMKAVKDSSKKNTDGKAKKRVKERSKIFESDSTPVIDNKSYLNMLLGKSLSKKLLNSDAGIDATKMKYKQKLSSNVDIIKKD